MRSEGSVEQSREPTNRNRIQGAVDQGERAQDREALSAKEPLHRSGGCAVKVAESYLWRSRLAPERATSRTEREVSRGQIIATKGPIIGPQNLLKVRCEVRKKERQKLSGTEAASAPAIINPKATSNQTDTQSITSNGRGRQTLGRKDSMQERPIGNRHIHLGMTFHATCDSRHIPPRPSSSQTPPRRERSVRYRTGSVAVMALEPVFPILWPFFSPAGFAVRSSRRIVGSLAELGGGIETSHLQFRLPASEDRLPSGP